MNKIKIICSLALMFFISGGVKAQDVSSQQASETEVTANSSESINTAAPAEQTEDFTALAPRGGGRGGGHGGHWGHGGGHGSGGHGGRWGHGGGGRWGHGGHGGRWGHGGGHWGRGGRWGHGRLGHGHGRWGGGHWGRHHGGRWGHGRHFGWGRHRWGGHHHHPGWHHGWRWNRFWRPHWWYLGIEFPLFIWAVDVPAGYYQCTAFDESLAAFSAGGATVNEAAYNALYECGGPNYEQRGCYIPANYCRLR